MKRIFNLSIGILSLLTIAYGDMVETNNGSQIVGVITKIENGTIHLATDYSEEIKIKQSEVKNIVTDNPIFVRVKSGSKILGKVGIDSDRLIKIDGQEGTLKASLGDVVESWTKESEDPEITREKEAAEKLLRKWQHEVSVDIAGKKGNSDETGTTIKISSTLKGPEDNLNFYGLIDRAKNDNTKTSDEVKAGVSYTAYFSEKVGWFTRMEIETDEFEDLDLRTTVAGGLSYRFFEEPEHSLVGKLGISYRNESFNTAPNAETVGLDIGVDHNYQFSKWGRVKTNIQFTPSIEDTADYRFVQDTGVEIPLGLSKFWKLRIGLANDYNSKPAAGVKKLDTSYYTRMILSWD